ncbi:MAG: hypothetical protein ACRDOX_03060 [Nocardioides sp.]
MRLPAIRPTYANVTSTLALLLATSGGAYAVTALPRDSVGTPQLQTGAVTTPKIAGEAVTSAKVRNGSLKLDDFAAGQLFKWEGAWSPTATYQLMDVVTDSGSTFVATETPVVGEGPGEFATWAFLAAAGQQGEPGQQGSEGTEGPAGPEGPQGEPGQDGAPGPSYGDTMTANGVSLDPCGPTTVASLPIHLEKPSRVLGLSSGYWAVLSPPTSYFVNQTRWIEVVNDSGNLVARTAVRSGSTTNGGDRAGDLDVNNLVSQPTVTVPAGDYDIRLRVITSADTCPSAYTVTAGEVQFSYVIVGATP